MFRTLFRNVSVLLALAAIVLSLSAWLGWRRPPNVILISIDTLRPDHLGAYGYRRPTSPAVDRFRQDAVLFREAIAHAPSTLPSHASIFTSLVPQHHGASHTRLLPLARQATTIQEVLRKQGYRTLAVASGGQLLPTFGLDQGFDTYRTIAEDGTFSDVVSEGLRLLDRRSDKPFFLFLHTYEVHHPYTPKPRRMAEFDRGYKGKLPDEISVELLTEIYEGRRKIGPADLQHIINAYDAEIASVDRSFGRLVDALKARGLYDNSVIVFTSDHGEEFGEHGSVGWHSHTLYDELLRVPLLVKLPAQARARAEVKRMVRSIDIAPTILDALALDPEPAFQGRTLLPFLDNEGERPMTAILWRETMPYETGTFSGIRVGEWKLHADSLFNLQSDPREQRNVVSEFSQMRENLRARLDAGLRERRSLTSTAIQLDEEARDSLRSLGYIQ